MNWYKHLSTTVIAAILVSVAAICGTHGGIESSYKTLPLLDGPGHLTSLSLIYEHPAQPGGLETELAALYSYLDEALRQNNKIEIEYAMIQRLCTFHNYGMEDSLLYYSPQTMAFLEKNRNWAGYYYVALLEAESFARSDQPLLAINSARRLYKKARSNDDDYGKGATACILGEVHYIRGDYDAAQQYMEEAVGYLRGEADPTMLFITYDRMRAVYFDKEMYQAALDVLRKLETAVEQHFAKPESDIRNLSGLNTRFYLWCGMGSVFARMHRFPEARKYISMADDIADKSFYKNHIYLAKSIYSEESGDYDSAIGWYRRTIPDDWNYAGAREGYEAASTFAALLRSAGRYREAADVYGKALRFADKIQSAEMDSQILEFQNLYRLDKMERYAHNLKIAASFIIFTLLSVFTVYIFYARRLRNKNRALSEQLRKVNLLRSLHQAIMTQYEQDAVGNAADNGMNGNLIPDGINAIQNGNGRKNENIVWLACRKMDEEKLFGNPALNRKQLADLLGTNENYLASAIRDVNQGQTVSDFINKFRLDHACRLITEFPQMKLETIARESGFTTRTTLFRLFHKKFGMSPGQYRDEHIKR